jgi:hypothetical protein
MGDRTYIDQEADGAARGRRGGASWHDLRRSPVGPNRKLLELLNRNASSTLNKAKRRCDRSCRHPDTEHFGEQAERDDVKDAEPPRRPAAAAAAGWPQQAGSERSI